MQGPPQHGYIRLLQDEKLLGNGVYIRHQQVVPLLIVSVHNLGQVNLGMFFIESRVPVAGNVFLRCGPVPAECNDTAFLPALQGVFRGMALCPVGHGDRRVIGHVQTQDRRILAPGGFPDGGILRAEHAVLAELPRQDLLAVDIAQVGHKPPGILRGVGVHQHRLYVKSSGVQFIGRLYLQTVHLHPAPVGSEAHSMVSGFQIDSGYERVRILLPFHLGRAHALIVHGYIILLVASVRAPAHKTQIIKSGLFNMYGQFQAVRLLSKSFHIGDAPRFFHGSTSQQSSLLRLIHRGLVPGIGL